MNTIDRIKQIIEESGFNQKEFCEYCEIGQSTLSSVLKGKGGVTLPLIMSINKAFPRYSLEWLLKGEDLPASSSPTTSPEEPAIFPDKVVETPPTTPPTLRPQSPQMSLAFTESPEVNGMTSTAASPTELFSQTPSESTQIVKNKEQHPRQVVEIRIFFDDGTYQVLAPKG